MRAEIRDKRIDRDRDGSRWFRAMVVVVDGDGDILDRRGVQYNLDNGDCGTPCIQKLVNQVKKKAMTAARNTQQVDLDAIS